MKGFQVLTVTTSQERIQNIQNAIEGLEQKSFSANTFLFKIKSNEQGNFPFYFDFQNHKGKQADIQKNRKSKNCYF